MPLRIDETPLFDPVAIERLAKVAGDQGAAFVAEMAQLFLQETQKTLADIKKGSEEGDRKLVTRLAHSVKSSAATLGLMRLSVACKALEAEATGGDFGLQREARVASVLDQFEQSVPILKGLS